MVPCLSVHFAMTCFLFECFLVTQKINEKYSISIWKFENGRSGWYTYMTSWRMPLIEENRDKSNPVNRYYSPYYEGYYAIVWGKYISFGFYILAFCHEPTNSIRLQATAFDGKRGTPMDSAYPPIEQMFKILQSVSTYYLLNVRWTKYQHLTC